VRHGGLERGDLGVHVLAGIVGREPEADLWYCQLRASVARPSIARFTNGTRTCWCPSARQTSTSPVARRTDSSAMRADESAPAARAHDFRRDGFLFSVGAQDDDAGSRGAAHPRRGG